MRDNAPLQNDKFCETLLMLRPLKRPLSLKEITDVFEAVVGSTENIECHIDFCRETASFHVVPYNIKK